MLRWIPFQSVLLFCGFVLTVVEGDGKFDRQKLRRTPIDTDTVSSEDEKIENSATVIEINIIKSQIFKVEEEMEMNR